jgi:hypothetical protein
MTELNKAVAVAVSTEPRVPAFIIEFVEKVVKHSVIINASGMLMASLTSANPAKGLMYVILLGLAIFVRIGFLILTSYAGPDNTSEMCQGDLPGALKFYDGGRNNIFVLSFSLLYIALPMLLAKDAKWHLIFMLVVQLALTCLVVHGKSCINKSVTYMLEIFGGALYGSTVSVIMYYAGLRSWLMLSGVPEDEEAQKEKNAMKSLRCKIRPF